MNDLYFTLFIALMWFASVTDGYTTLIGFANGLTELNPVYSKILGKHAAWALGNIYGFLTTSVVKLALSVGLFEVAQALGHNHNADTWVPAAIFAGFTFTTIRNIVLIKRKK